MSIIQIISIVIGAITAITIHQFTYALVSVKLGDPIPKNQGRLTLNPIKHIEPVGLIILIISGFGWGKPVNINPSYYRYKKKGTITVSISGIVANLVFAVIVGFILRILNLFNYQIYDLGMILIYIVKYNVILAVVNLIPVYPLDGYKILLSLVKPNTYFRIIQYERIIQMIVILLAFTGILGIVLNPIISIIFNLII